MTSKRFFAGIHPTDECRSNKTGYAAIDAASTVVDLHNIDAYPINTSYQESKHRRKRSISSYDALAYTMLKILSFSIRIQVFVILMSKDSSIHGAPQDIVNSISSKGIMVIGLVDDSDGIDLVFYYDGLRCTTEMMTLDEIKEMLQMVNTHKDMIMITHPIMSSIWTDLINSTRPSIWCVPSCRMSRYVSTNEDSCAHFLYPWSRHPSFAGYTIGTGPIRECTMEECYSYIGRCNFYSSMISCAPLRGSCVDCEAMINAGNKLSEMTSKHHRTPSRENPMSRSSIIALDGIDKMIKELTDSDKSEGDNVAT